MMTSVSTNGAAPRGVAPFFRAMTALATMAFAAAASAQAPDLERAKKIVGGGCFLCHGADGESSSEVFPKLGGQKADYIEHALHQYKSGERKDPIMGAQVAALTDADIRALASYFAAQPGLQTATYKK